MTACWRSGEIWREGNELIVLVVGLAVDEGLEAALDVDGGGGRVDEFGGDEGERGDEPGGDEGEGAVKSERAKRSLARG